MARTTVPLSHKGIETLPNDKSALCRILTEGGKTNHAGIAKRGRGQERLAEHLPGAKEALPGARVQIERMPTVGDAQSKETRVVSRSKPPYNEKGK